MVPSPGRVLKLTPIKTGWLGVSSIKTPTSRTFGSAMSQASNSIARRTPIGPSNNQPSKLVATLQRLVLGSDLGSWQDRASILLKKQLSLSRFRVLGTPCNALNRPIDVKNKTNTRYFLMNFFLFLLSIVPSDLFFHAFLV